MPLPDPIFWKSKILAFELETTYGAGETLTGADAFLATDVRLLPQEGTDTERDLETPFMSTDGTIPAELHSKISFKVELQGSGAAGTPPPALGKLLRACATAEVITPATSVAYNPVSDGHESGVFHVWIGDTRYVLAGARGNAKPMISAQGIPYVEMNFNALYAAPSEQTRITPDFSAFQKPKIGSKANTPTFTIDGTDFVLREASLDFGNKLENRFLIGRESVLITDKSEALEVKVEAQTLSTFNPFAAAIAGDELAVELVHGTEAGKIVTLDVPRAQIQRVQGLESAQNVKEWPLRFIPLDNAGNDQWTLTFT